MVRSDLDQRRDQEADKLTPEQEADVAAALLAFWTSQDEAARAQQARGVNDVGGRAGVTSGGHLDRVAQLLGRICIGAGAPKEEVFYKYPVDDPNKRAGASIGYTLPGYYRPTKQWDLVVYRDNVPIVAIELKSQKGPSYSNNANNRAEEALGNALDFRRAQQAGLIPGDPWIGYVFVIQDDEKSRRGRGNQDRGRFPKDRMFEGWSYVERVRRLCQRLVEDEHYDRTWAVATSAPPNFSWDEPDAELSGYVQFLTGLTAAIGRHYDGVPRTGQAKLSLF
ncbi:PaeR7I family type II restriction endonuclease [Pseudonocardia adelaidensis]|uniref:PaeR7I family type II restriction endonuclease n=1 Tax=Pseudonocardia adelaidensis TaxID=648754 RepID=A0ABP9P4P1_9PSEU